MKKRVDSNYSYFKRMRLMNGEKTIIVMLAAASFVIFVYSIWPCGLPLRKCWISGVYSVIFTGMFLLQRKLISWYNTYTIANQKDYVRT